MKTILNVLVLVFTLTLSAQQISSTTLENMRKRTVKKYSNPNYGANASPKSKIQNREIRARIAKHKRYQQSKKSKLKLVCGTSTRANHPNSNSRNNNIKTSTYRRDNDRGRDRPSSARTRTGASRAPAGALKSWGQGKIKEAQRKGGKGRSKGYMGGASNKQGQKALDKQNNNDGTTSKGNRSGGNKSGSTGGNKGNRGMFEGGGNPK